MRTVHGLSRKMSAKRFSQIVDLHWIVLVKLHAILTYHC